MRGLIFGKLEKKRGYFFKDEKKGVKIKRLQNNRTPIQTFLDKLLFQC